MSTKCLSVSNNNVICLDQAPAMCLDPKTAVYSETTKQCHPDVTAFQKALTTRPLSADATRFAKMPRVCEMSGFQKVQDAVSSGLIVVGGITTFIFGPEMLLLSAGGLALRPETTGCTFDSSGLATPPTDGGVQDGATDVQGDRNVRKDLVSGDVRDGGVQDVVRSDTPSDVNNDKIPGNNPPTAPVLASEPANGVTWAPTRLYLSWDPSTDPDAGDSVTYNVYFVKGNSISDGTPPYKSGITDTHFVIQASTDGRTQYNPDNGVAPIYLEPNQTYSWKICAKDSQGVETCRKNSQGIDEIRQFNTDNSGAGWWRFDTDPNGPACPSNLGKPGAPGGGPGETVCDYSGNGNHGMPQGGVMLVGGAYVFNGNAYVSVPNSASLNITGAISVEAVVEPNASGDVELFNKAGNSNAGNYLVEINSMTGAINFRFYHGVMGESNRTYSAASSSLIAGVKSLLAIRHTFGLGTDAEIRVENVPQASSWTIGTGNEMPVMVSNDVSIGALVDNMSYDYKGAGYEIILYNKRLSTAELDNGFYSRR
jgi:hypothetical protein